MGGRTSRSSLISLYFFFTTSPDFIMRTFILILALISLALAVPHKPRHHNHGTHEPHHDGTHGPHHGPHHEGSHGPHHPHGTHPPRTTEEPGSGDEDLIIDEEPVIRLAMAQRDDDCGVNGLTASDVARIVGGDESNKGDWPWMISLRFPVTASQQNPGHICGGTIIADNWALCAGHCFMNSQNPAFYKVRVGEHNKNVVAGDEVNYEVEQIFQHPGFGLTIFGSAVNDISLIKLKRSIDFSNPKLAAKSCLPAGDQNTDNRQAVATGWGYTKELGPDSPILQQMYSVVSTDAMCNNYWGSFMFKEGMMCYGVNNGNSSPCQGDSGGPIQIYEGDRWVQVGVTSFGEANCKGKPAVYTRISTFIDWVHATMANN